MVDTRTDSILSTIFPVLIRNDQVRIETILGIPKAEQKREGV